MTRLHFVKMEGCGNDYVHFDCFDQCVPDPGALSRLVSDRHFGIGGDGIILILPSDKADARMRMFNADGSEGRMCGNAIRCVGKYLYDSGRVRSDRITVDTMSGTRLLQMHLEDGVATGATVDMGKAGLHPSAIPVLLDGDRVVGREAVIDTGLMTTITCVSMGNPHCVVFVDDTDALDLPAIGPRYENSALFPQRVNTEFVKVIDDHTLQMRVWERGSGETLACGTGTCAAVVAAVENGLCPKGEDIAVRLIGGELTIRYTDEGVTMTGPARRVFEGDWELD